MVRLGQRRYDILLVVIGVILISSVAVSRLTGVTFPTAVSIAGLASAALITIGLFAYPPI